MAVDWDIETYDTFTKKMWGGRLLKMPYTIHIDHGKPYPILCRDDQELREELENLKQVSEQDWAHFDIRIEDDQGNDVTESQWVQEMIGEILEGK